MNEICSICQTQISSSANIKVCEICGAKYHLECWDEIKGCASFQCPNNPRFSPDTGITEEFQTGVKTCPMCGESIELNVKVCPYCSEQFDTIAPISQAEIKEKYSKSDEKIPENKVVVWIFGISLFGITAPFLLIFGISWYLKNKQILIEHSPAYNLLAKISFFVSGFYLLLFILAIIFNA